MKYSQLSIIVLILLATILLTDCSRANIPSSAKGNSLYDRVLRSGKIRAAYAIYPPYCMKDPNTGKMSGIGVEALELIAKKLGLIMEYTEEVGWGSIIEGLQTNRYDILACPGWTNPRRAKIVGFSKPLCFQPVFAYARKDDQRFAPLTNANLPSVTTSSIDGTTEDLVAQTDFPKAHHLTMPQLTDISQNFLNLTSKKADIVIAEPGFATRFLKANPDTIKNLDPQSPLRIYPMCWIFKRNEFEFKNMIDTVLDEIVNDGRMERIIRRYEPNKNVLFMVAKPYRVH